MVTTVYAVCLQDTLLFLRGHGLDEKQAVSALFIAYQANSSPQVSNLEVYDKIRTMSAECDLMKILEDKSHIIAKIIYLLNWDANV